MELIDTDLNDTGRINTHRPLNQLKLAALIAVILSGFFESEITNDIYSAPEGWKNGPWVFFIVNIMSIVGALLCDILRSTRMLPVAGLAIMIFLQIFCAYSNKLQGNLLAVLYYGATGLCSVPLLKGLLVNTRYFGSTQKAVFIAKTAAHLFFSFIFQTAFLLKSSDIHVQNWFGGMLLLIGALVVLLIDREEEQPQENMPAFLAQHPGFWPKVILPLFLVLLVFEFCARINDSHFYTAQIWLMREESWMPFLYLACMVLPMGLLLLLLLLVKTNKPWLFLFIGALPVLVLTLVALTTKEIPGMLWLFILLNIIGNNMVAAGIAWWQYKYTSFPFLATLLVLPQICSVVLYGIAKIFHLTILH